MSIPIRGTSHGSPGAAFETAKRRGAQRLPKAPIHAMNTGMFSLRHYFKVFRSIVGAIIVDVMHDFTGEKVAANFALSNKSVLSNVTGLRSVRVIRHLDVDVPLAFVHKPGRTVSQGACSDHRCMKAILAAESLRLGPIGLRLERLAALLARALQWSRIRWIGSTIPVHACTRTVTRTGNFRRHYVECLAAVFTGHIWGKMRVHSTLLTLGASLGTSQASPGHSAVLAGRALVLHFGRDPRALNTSPSCIHFTTKARHYGLFGGATWPYLSVA